MNPAEPMNWWLLLLAIPAAFFFGVALGYATGDIKLNREYELKAKEVRPHEKAV